MLNPNDNASDNRSAKPKKTRISEDVKRAVIKAVLDGLPVQVVSRKFNLKAGTVYSIVNTRAKLSVVAIRKQKLNEQYPTANESLLTIDSQNKLRDIALYCECNKSEAINACVAFYYKHLREVVTQRIKG